MLRLSGIYGIYPSEKLITYRIVDFEEPITLEELVKMSEMVGGAPCTIKTNAGVELHSKYKGVYKGITIKRL